MPGLFPAPPPKPGKSALGTREGGEGGGLFEAAPPERGSFFRLQVYESIGFHLNTLAISERVGKSVILGLKDAFYGC